MKKAIIAARIVLAIIYLVYGTNYFLHFFPSSLPPGKAGDFMGGLRQSGYLFEYMKAMQIIGAVLLFINRWAVMTTIVLFPISLNIFLFHVFLQLNGLGTAVILIAANLFLLYAYRPHYRVLLAKRPLQ